MREIQLSTHELLRRTEDVYDLIDTVVNGHPSIDEEHFCWDALQELGEMDEEQIIEMYNNIHAIV